MLIKRKSLLENVLKILNNYPYVISGILGIFSYIYFFPGYIAGDTVGQWFEVTNKMPVSNYHPPIMVYLWKFTRLFFEGPGGLHLLHCLFYWTAISLLARYFTSRNWLRVSIIICFGLFPPIYLWSLHLLKDSGLLVSFAMSVALLLNYQKNKSKICYLFFSLIFIFYGIAVRHNAIFAGLILLYLNTKLIYEYYNSNNYGKSAKFIFGSFKKSYVIVALMMVILISLVNNVGVRRYSTFGTVYIWDLAAISVYQDKMLLPREALIDKNLPDEEILRRLKKNFIPNRCNGIFGEDAVVQLVQKEVYLGHYLRVILDNLGSYLAHRIHFSSYLLGISHTHSISKGYYYPEVNLLMKNYVEERKDSKLFTFLGINKDLTISMSTNNQSFVKFLVPTGDDYNILFSPYVYFIIFLALVVIRQLFSLYSCAPKLNPQANSMIVFAGGLLYILPLCLFAPAEDYRYTVWFIFSSIIASILLIQETFNEKRYDKI